MCRAADNAKQVELILRYKDFLEAMWEREVSDDEAAFRWVKYHAQEYKHRRTDGQSDSI